MLSWMPNRLSSDFAGRRFLLRLIDHMVEVQCQGEGQSMSSRVG